MSGFKEFIKNDKREKTLNFLSNVFKIKRRTKLLLCFWVFLISTLISLYYSLTWEDKYIVECGEITKMISKKTCSNCDNYHFIIFYQNDKKMIKSEYVLEDEFNTYLDMLIKNNNNYKFCIENHDYSHIFVIILTIILSIISIVYIVIYTDTNYYD